MEIIIKILELNDMKFTNLYCHFDFKKQIATTPTKLYETLFQFSVFFISANITLFEKKSLFFCFYTIYISIISDLLFFFFHIVNKI